MKAVKRLCWNCDGNVHLYEMNCPYCGAELASSEASTNPNEPLANAVAADAIPQPAFSSYEEESFIPSDEEWNSEEKDIDNSMQANEIASLMPLLLLLPGSLFLIFGLALFLFSDNGFLVFQFNGRYWFVYLGLSFPLMYFGLKQLFPLSKVKK